MKNACTNLSIRFRKYVEENSLAGKNDRILLAVSGGVDSMVMLSLFAEEGYDVGIAHCNFQLRGREAEEDEVMVEEAAAKYGVPYYGIRFDTQGEMERTGESVQMAARRLRYGWFDSLSNEHGYTLISIAHHADDSIETFLINLFRGTGLKGLTGIGVVNGRIIRPLMFASRKEILDYAHAKDIRFREDSSNKSSKYLRNKIRLGLVPRMKEISSQFTQIMSLNISRLTDAQLFINRSIELIRDDVEEKQDGMTVIDPSRIDAKLPARFVIYELLNKYGFKGDVVDSLYHTLLEGASGRRFYSREHVAYTDRDKIIITPIEESDPCSVTVNRNTPRTYCGNSVLFFEVLNVDSIETLKQPENIALLDADRIEFPVTLRKWNDGDSFVPLGMDGHKKVSDYLIDEKVSLPDKRRQFVLVSGDDIIWLVGRRIDDRYKVTPSTENILRVVKETL